MFVRQPATHAAASCKAYKDHGHDGSYRKLVNTKEAGVHPEPCKHGYRGRDSGKKEDWKESFWNSPAGGIHNHLLSFKTNEKTYMILCVILSTLYVPNGLE